MPDSVLLDTCAALWLMGGEPMSEASLTAIPDSVPEPSSLAGIVTGLGMLAFLRRHRQRT